MTLAAPEDAAPDPSAPAPGGRSIRTAGMLTAGLGVTHAVLLITAFLLLQTVPRGGPQAEVLAFYSDTDRRRLVLVGLYLLPFAGIAFIWFEVALRMWISGTHRRANVLLSNVQLVSGILFLALFFASAATSAATATAVEFADAVIDPVFATMLPVYGDTLMYVFAIRMAAMFVFTTTSIARSANVLPRWFVWLGYILGTVMLFSATFSALLALLFPVWILVLSALLFRRARALPADLRAPVDPASVAPWLPPGSGA